MTGNPPLSLILIAAGLIFLFAGIVGGRLKIWQLDMTVPWMSKAARLSSVGVGMLLIGLPAWTYLKPSRDKTDPSEGNSSTPSASKPAIGAQKVAVGIPKVSSGSYFFEDFSARQLPAYWKVLEPDPERWKLRSKSLLIITEKGSLWNGATNLRNQFILDKELPQEDFEVIVEASFQIQNQNNSLSIALFHDHDNFLELGYWGQPWGYNVRRVPQFTKQFKGERNQLLGGMRGFGGVGSPETLFFRIERHSDQYTGYYSFIEEKAPENVEDIRWNQIGTQSWIDFTGKLSIWADNSNSDVYSTDNPTVPETPADFHLILLRRI